MRMFVENIITIYPHEKNIINIMAKFLTRLSQALQKDRSTPPENRDVPASKSSVTFGIGALINGRYRLDEEIGRGGMGIVYRAHDLPNNRDVAIKIINFDKANNLTHQRFLHEAEIASRLNHPHIVTVYETGATEASPFIVMELVHSKSLEELRAFTYARILDIGKQICDALEYAHQQGLVYRDLKPGNVLIEKRGFRYFVKLNDFGLARPRGMNDLENESSTAGTLFYLAPELIAGQPADVASDLYALGATLYEMITGHVPFSDFDEQTILSQHLEESVTPPSQSRPGVPPTLEAIVLSLLAKNPKDRFASAQAVCEALEQIVLTSQNGDSCTNLPELLTDFAGKENDIARVKGLLETNPLVTLLGDDRILAITIGKQLIDEFSDGVWWVEVGQLSNPSWVAETVAVSLGIQKDPHRSLIVSLIGYLREKNLLLILNHCDHVLDACAQLVETILPVCPDVQILVVSHHLLNVAGEASY